MKNIVQTICCGSLILVLTGCCSTTVCKVNKEIAASLGPEYDDYERFTYPTNNFGLLTSYRGDPKEREIACAMWRCIGVEDNNVPTGLGQWLAFEGFATVGDGGGSITLESDLQTKFGLEVLLPKIYKIVNAGAQFDSNNVENVTVTLGRAYPRSLSLGMVRQYIQDLQTNSPNRLTPDQKELLRAVSAGDWNFAAEDVVIDNIKVRFSAKGDTGGKLTAAIGGAGSTKVFEDAKLSVEGRQVSADNFVFETKDPVIFMRRIRKQKEAGGVSREERIENFPVVSSGKTYVEP